MTLTTPDGETLHTVSWLPDAAHKAIILLVHGVAEHSGRYAHVAARLVAAGYGVYAFDHRGHGKSTGTRVYFKNADQPVNDLKQVFDHVQQQHPETRCFVLGHSMGSLITLDFALRYQHDLAGVITSGTPLNIDEATPDWLITVGRFAAKYVPKLHAIPLDANDLSQDPAVVADYKTDPLVYNRPLRLAIASYLLDHSTVVREQVYQLRLPLLILHGSADNLAPASGSTFLMNNAGSPDKTIHIYPDLYHEIFNEPERDQVLDDLVAWLDAH